MIRRSPSLLSAILCILWMIEPCNIAWAQTFGGSAPWGTETPARFRGEIHIGQEYEHPIGGGLSLRVKDWYIEIGPSGSNEDFSDCETGRTHGPTAKELTAWRFQGSPASPGGVGDKREINFALTSTGNDAECRSIARIYNGQDTGEESRTSGRCLFRPLSVSLSHDAPEQQVIEALTFEAECGLYGALELWRLPARYVIPAGFTGWISVYSGQQGQPELPRKGAHIVVNVGKSHVILTSSVLRTDSLGEGFVSTRGAAMAAGGPDREIWGETRGYGSCGSFTSFFVGTETAYRKNSLSPSLMIAAPRLAPPGGNCSISISVRLGF